MSHRKFAIIMASHLASYPGAAKDRIAKFHRAVQSVMHQSYSDFQLFIISDGCPITIREARTYDSKDPKHHIECRMVEKQPTFSGKVRNFGIHHCEAEYILYLDTDDYLGKQHLEIILTQLNGEDWVFFDDYAWAKGSAKWLPRQCDVTRKFRYGTSNICHKKELEVYWKNTGYEHDYHFVNELKMKSKSHKYIGQGQYYVCHVPQRYDV